MSVLPEDVLIEVADMLSAPPTEDPYEALKNAIISRASPSNRQRLRELISSEPLGDRKPSQLLRRLQHLQGGSDALVSTQALRQLFVSKLPPSVQLVLAVADQTDLQALAGRADQLMELVDDSDSVSGSSSSRINACNIIPTEEEKSAVVCQASTSHGHHDDLASLRNEVRRLADAMEQCRLIRPAQAPPPPPFRRNGSPRPAPLSRRSSPVPTSRRQLCWYHSRFGRRARRCESPCDWQGNIPRDR